MRMPGDYVMLNRGRDRSTIRGFRGRLRMTGRGFGSYPMSQGDCDLVKRFFDEAFNRGDTSVIKELIAREHVSHLPNGDHYGPEGVRIDVDCFRSAFSDLHLDIDELIEAKERVVYRFTARGTHDGPFMGVPASGRRVEVNGIGIDRIADGKTVERWVQYDSAGLFQQLGVLPS
jgi:steroid delta-isomerase-like uncharacterized protein